MKTFKFVFKSVIFGILIIGCNKNPDNKSKISSLTSSNLAGAKETFITGSLKRTTKSGTDDYDNLKFYKVGIDNQTQPVIFTDDYGNTVPAIVDYVHSLSSKYAVMRVYNEEVPYTKFVFIIRKNDGKLYATPETIKNNGTLWDDPLIFFLQDGLNNFTRFIKSDAEGNVYFLAGGLLHSGLLRKIHEKDGNTTVTSMEVDVWDNFTFNAAGDIFANVYDAGSNQRISTWITADGQKIKFDSHNIFDSGLIVPFALSCAPSSFFFIDQIHDNTPARIWEKTVLAEYTIQDGKIFREVVHEFTKKLNEVTVTKEGIGMASHSYPNLGEICVIKDKTNDGISYFPLSENSLFYDGQLQSLSCDRVRVISSYRYAYNYKFNCFDYTLNSNRISRFDPQTGTDMPNYYTLPNGYILIGLQVSYDDILTIRAGVGGINFWESVWIIVDADGKDYISDTYNGEKVLFRSAF